MVLKKLIKLGGWSVCLKFVLSSLLALMGPLLNAKKVEQYSVLNMEAGYFNQKVDSSSHYQTYDFFAANKLNLESSSFKYKHDIGVYYQSSNNFDSFDLMLSEFYLTNKSLQHEFSVGRRQQTLSLVDEEWALGLTSSLFNHDPINPVSQGDLGFHYKYQRYGYFIKAFASPMHLPHQGPQFSNKNNSIQSGSPWFNQPPRQIEEVGGLSDIRYKINKPKISDVIFQPSVSLSVGSQGEGFGWSLSYQNKINNEFHKSYRFSQEVGIADFIYVEVDAETFRHQLYSANLSYRNNNISSWVSYLKDQPDASYTKDGTWLETRLNDEDWASVGVKYKNLVFNNLDVSSSYLRKLNDRVSDKKNLLSLPELEPLLSRTYFYRTESFNVKLDYQYKFSKKSSLTFSNKFEYSIKGKSQLFVSKINYKKEKMSIFAEAGILSAGENDKTSFQSRFKGNDHVNLGLGYVF